MKFVLATIVFVLTLPAALWADASAVIEGPTKANPGDLVILDGSESIADSRQWLLVNSDKQFLAFEENRKIVFASGTPGDYVFMLAVAQSVDDVSTISIVKHTVTVGTPEPPVPPPTPTPGPNPPTPPVPPNPDLSGISKQTYEIVKSLDWKTGEPQKHAAAFRSVTRKAKSENWDSRRISQETISAIRSAGLPSDVNVRWAAFNAWFVPQMQGAEDAGSVIETLEQIAAGLEVFPVSAVRDESNDSLRGKVEKLKGELNSIEREVGP